MAEIGMSALPIVKHLDIFKNSRLSFLILLSKSGHQECEEYNHFGGVLYGKEAESVYEGV